MENLSRRGQEKQEHESEILSAAERVFCLKGYEDASMDEIAKEAQFTKRTVYQHFENKDELYFAVVLRGFRRLSAKIREAGKREPTGYDKLEKACRAYDRFYRENPDFVRLIDYWGYARGKSSDGSENKNALIRHNDDMARDIADMIDQGKEDGSVQPGIDTEKTAACLMLLISGFYSQLSAAGGSFFDYAGSDREGFGLQAIELVVRPLKRSRAAASARKGTA